MATIQQSIEIRVPVHAAYNQLTQFEDYPRFLEEVKTVQQLDDTHLHWTTIMSNRPVEWDAEITEQEPDRCIAWHNISGPTNAGRVELQPVGSDASRIIFTLASQPEQVPGSPAGNSEEEMAQRLKLDLARLKDFIETSGTETGARRGEVPGAQATTRDRDAREQPGATGSAAGQKADEVATLGIAQGTGQTGDQAGRQGADQVATLGSRQGSSEAADAQEGRGSPRNSPAPTSSYAAGSEGFAGTEEPTSPVTSSSQAAADQSNESAGSVSQQPPSSSSPASGQQPANIATQPNMTRHVGQMPQDTSAEGHGSTPTSDAMGKSMQQGRQDDMNRKQAADSAAFQAQPERVQQPGAGRAADDGTGVGGTAAAVGAAGGTDASAGARMAGGPAGKDHTGAPGGSATAGTTEPNEAAADGGGSPAAGADAAGGARLGGADVGADAGDTRAVPREGTAGATGGSAKKP